MSKPLHTLHLDSDSFLYQCAHKAQPVCYWVQGQDFKTKAEAIEWCTQFYPEGIEGIKKEEFLCPPYMAKEMLKDTVDRITEVYKKWFDKNLSDDYKLHIEYYISSKENFRYSIYPEYKGHRPEKPRWYELLRGEFIHNYNPIIKPGFEADDAVAENHYAMWKADTSSTCIASLDKDLYNIPGLHYNTREYCTGTVSKQAACETFLMQLLTGDTTDNIKGVPKVGEKTATKLLATDQTFKTTKLYFKDRMKNVIIPAYEKAFGDKGKYQAALNFKLLDVGQIYEKDFKYNIDKVIQNEQKIGV